MDSHRLEGRPRTPSDPRPDRSRRVRRREDLVGVDRRRTLGTTVAMLIMVQLTALSALVLWDALVPMDHDPEWVVHLFSTSHGHSGLWISWSWIVGILGAGTAVGTVGFGLVVVARRSWGRLLALVATFTFTTGLAALGLWALGSVEGPCVANVLHVGCHHPGGPAFEVGTAMTHTCCS